MAIAANYWQVAWRGILALLAFTALSAAYAAIDSATSPNAVFGPGASAWLVFAYTLILRLPVVLIYGVPVYIFLAHHSYLSWPRLLLAAVLPAIFVLPFDRGAGIMFVVGGLFIAIATHTLVRARPLTMRSSGP